MTGGKPLTILMTGEIAPDLEDEIEAVAPGARVRHYDDLAQLEADIETADIVATNHLTPSALARAKRLKWVQSWSAGPDALMFPDMIESAVTLTCCKGNGAIPLAEHSMMMMLMLDRDMPRSMRAQAERRWDRFYHGELNGRTCGIIGTGHSGTDLAAKARAFHMRVVGLRRTAREAPEFDHVYATGELHDFLAESDFLVVTAPLTAESRGLLGKAEFARMKKTAFYICISRGGIADDAALLDALRSGQIAGAGLDAHAVEPLPTDSPFWDLPNVIVTPHHGALAKATRRRGYDIFVDNIRRYVNGEPLHNIVDKQAGY